MARKRPGSRKVAKVARTAPPVPRMRRVVFGDADRGRNFSEEFQDVILSGLLIDCGVGHPCNVVRSVLDAVRAEELRFERCDFKDTSIRNSTFTRSLLGHSSWLYNSVTNTTFDSCSFSDWSLQNSDFDRVTFVNCDLRNVIIKTCRFDRCEFVSCTTNNKLFETSRITHCRFRDTELQIETIVENFGITQSQYHGLLRSGRSDAPHRRLAPSDVRSWLHERTIHPVGGVSVEYFLNETLLEGSVLLDRASDLSSWLPLFRTAGSFTVTLNQWIEFLLWIFERNQVTVHTLIAFHSMTDQLIRTLEARAPEQSMSGNLSGSHLALARAIDVYLDSLDRCVEAFPAEMNLLVEGQGTPAFYYRALAPLFERSAASITRVVQHNSPWDLTVTFGPGSSTFLFVAFFLATRTSFELNKLHAAVTKRSFGMQVEKYVEGGGATGATTPTTLFALDVGLAKPPAGSPGFRLKAYLPGNLLAELKLNVSSRQIAKVRKVLVDLLS